MRSDRRGAQGLLHALMPSCQHCQHISHIKYKLQRLQNSIDLLEYNRFIDCQG